MKKMIISLALCLSALAVSARDYSYPVGYYRLQSNHSVSTTLLGLEYSYEGRVADRWTLIGCAGLVPLGFTLATYPGEGMIFSGTMGLGLSFEGRWYPFLRIPKGHRQALGGRNSP